MVGIKKVTRFSLQQRRNVHYLSDSKTYKFVLKKSENLDPHLKQYFLVSVFPHTSLTQPMTSS